MMSKWKVEVIADSSGLWCGNAMVYDSKEEAEEAAKDLMSRWMLVREWRVVECSSDDNKEVGNVGTDKEGR
jgi:hypothetical protein